MFVGGLIRKYQRHNLVHDHGRGREPQAACMRKRACSCSLIKAPAGPHRKSARFWESAGPLRCLPIALGKCTKLTFDKPEASDRHAQTLTTARFDIAYVTRCPAAVACTCALAECFCNNCRQHTVTLLRVCPCLQSPIRRSRQKAGKAVGLCNRRRDLVLSQEALQARGLCHHPCGCMSASWSG